MKQQILEKVETLNEYQLKVTDEFLTNLTKIIELPEIFKEKLEQLKNTPMDEPKVAAKKEDAIQRELGEVEYSLELVETIFTISELDAINEKEQLELKDLVKFGAEIDKKVFGFKEVVDGAEVFKEIPSQNELKPLSYSKKKEIRDLSFKARKISDALKDEKDTEKILKIFDELTALDKELIKAAASSHNLDESKMTKWEKDLLMQKITSHAMGAYNPPLGKK